MDKSYRLVAYLDNDTGVHCRYLIVYSGQFIDGIEAPEKLMLNSPLPSGTIFLVEVSDDLLSARSIVKTYSDGEWLFDEIEAINKYNKNIISSSDCAFKSIPIPDDVIIDQSKWDFIIATIELGKYPLFMGPSGCGKSTLTRHIANAMGYKFYYLNCGTLEKPKSSLIGTVTATAGTTAFVPSEFMSYFQSSEKVIIMLDEISRIPSQAAKYLMTIMDREQSYIYVEELAVRIYKGENVIFVATANFGMQYVDTRKLDQALKNRLIPYHLNYVPEDDEVRMIMRRVKNIREDNVRKLVKCANLLRKNYDSLGEDISHRHTLDMADFMSVGFSLKDVIENVLMSLFINGDDDKREQVEMMLNGKIL